MSSYVLVPGAWLGGWAWEAVAARLRKVGHDIYPVTLTGLDDKAYLATPEVDLETYVSDVIGLIEEEDLNEVILVGHSFGGAVAGGVADRIPERLARVVYVDAGPLPSGSAYMDLLAPETQELVNELIQTRGEGWRIPLPSFDEIETLLGASFEGLEDQVRAAIAERATPQPAGTWTRPLHRENEAAAAIPKTLIACSFPLAQVKEMISAGHPWFAELAGPEWSLAELPTGHWPMFSRPDDLAALLAGL